MFVNFREMLDRLTTQAYTARRNSTTTKIGKEAKKTKIKNKRKKNFFFCYRKNTCLFRDIPVSN